jgi:hypothetical protein
MNADNPASGSSSAATSGKKPNAPEPDAPPQKLSEAEFLAQQAQTARLAIEQAWHDIKSRLGQRVDPKAWAQEHPWITVSAAAVAGFVATATLVPSKEQQALNKLAAIERALNPAPPEGSNGDGKKENRSILGAILIEAVGALRPVIASLLSANLGGAAPSASPPHLSEPPPRQ